MKICFFIDDFTRIGGIERVTSVLASYLAENTSLNVEIVSQFKGRERPNYPISDKVVCHYLNASNYGERPHSLQRIFKQLMNRNRIRRFFKENSYDTIVAQAFPNNFILYWSGIDLSRVFAVEHVHCDYYGSMIKKLRIFVYKKVNKVIVLTNNDKEYFDLHLPQQKVIVIPNPIGIENGAQPLLLNQRVISVGRLEFQKGYDNLIQVFEKVHRKYPDWKLDIYGQGTLKNLLQQQINEYGLEGVVTLCGVTNNINEKLRDASFFVMSSRFEGFGMVLVEAMAQGVPCVSYDCPNGPSDIIRDGEDGILVENQNQNALEKAMLRLIENPEERKRMGQNATKNVQRFSTANVARMWMALFREMIPD